MVLTREQREEIKVLVDVVIKQLWSDKTFIKTIVDNVSTEITIKVNKKMEEYEKQVTEVKSEIYQIKEDIQEIHTNKAMEINSIKTFLDENYVTKDKFDNMEQETKKNNLRIFKLPEKEHGNLKLEVMEVIKSNLKIKISENDIEDCYRIGKFNENKMRGIFLKLSTFNTKQLIYKNKKLFKGTGIVVKEDLTVSRMFLLEEAIKKFSLRNVWTHLGKVYIKTNNSIKNVNSIEQLIN